MQGFTGRVNIVPIAETSNEIGGGGSSDGFGAAASGADSLQTCCSLRAASVARISSAPLIFSLRFAAFFSSLSSSDTPRFMVAAKPA
jgi:hypothetical protein